MIIYLQEKNNYITINGITVPTYININGKIIEAKIRNDEIEYIYKSMTMKIDTKNHKIHRNIENLCLILMIKKNAKISKEHIQILLTDLEIYDTYDDIIDWTIPIELDNNGKKFKIIPDKKIRCMKVLDGNQQKCAFNYDGDEWVILLKSNALRNEYCLISNKLKVTCPMFKKQQMHEKDLIKLIQDMQSKFNNI